MIDLMSFVAGFFGGYLGFKVDYELRKALQAPRRPPNHNVEIDDNGHRVLVISLTKKRYDSTLGECPGSVGGGTTPCAVPNQGEKT